MKKRSIVIGFCLDGENINATEELKNLLLMPYQTQPIISKFANAIVWCTFVKTRSISIETPLQDLIRRVTKKTGQIRYLSKKYNLRASFQILVIENCYGDRPIMEISIESLHYINLLGAELYIDVKDKSAIPRWSEKGGSPR